MNKFYIITPFVMMLLFGGVFWKHSQASAIEAKQVEMKIAQAKAEEAAKKEAAVVKAREDSAKRTAARLAEEQQQEADKRAKWESAGQRIASDTATAEATIVKHTAAIKALEAELTQLRATKEKVNTKSLEVMQATELARIAKRNAELEIQRLTEMVARKAAGTSLAAMP